MRSFQISGGPKWIDTAQFDIDARLTTTDAGPRANPGLTLEVQRKANEALRSLVVDRFLLTFHQETRGQTSFALVVAKSGPKLQASTESQSLIRSVGRGLGRPVVDKTGLTGKYTFELKWDGSPPTPAQSTVASDPDVSSIFTALQEQLGLRLVSQEGPERVLVVDGAERPSEN